MSYIVERREEEKERRRAEILDAAIGLYAQRGWESVTVEQVARSARLSRALVYVYFRDKEDVLFAIGERAMRTLRDRFVGARASAATGIAQVEAIGRAYVGYAHEFPHFFDFCSRFQSHSASADPSSNEGACQQAGAQVMAVLMEAIETGIADGTIRADVGSPVYLATSLWAFTHGTIQVAMAKGAELARRGIAIPEFIDYSLRTILRMAQAPSTGH